MFGVRSKAPEISIHQFACLNRFNMGRMKLDVRVQKNNRPRLSWQ